ncbi:disulfide bond formation protein B [Endozoicomonas montiporae]|uniref:Disulfide bond formation protein B n=1 Tax=Endozoicomonas montiporae TaxID=1027273 RepID=A0A081N4Z6_9GAMM|nr:disulfide bond formation protein B [Endozoicomonas montiporae]
MNALGLLALSGVLGFALLNQFACHDLPCPLCLLQRIAFTGCMFAILLNIFYGTRPWHYGILLVSAMLGAGIALRQISLHVIPGNPGYGGTVFSWHFYTWSFLCFTTIIATVSLTFLVPSHFSVSSAFIGFGAQPAWIKLAVVLCYLVVSVNMVSAFLECGFYACAENPVHYKLLQGWL